MYRIVISDVRLEDIQPILEEQVGQGGFQALLRKIKTQYSERRAELQLDKEDIERLYRYAKKYGRGGFQDRIQPLLEKLNIIKMDLLRILDS